MTSDRTQTKRFFNKLNNINSYISHIHRNILITDNLRDKIYAMIKYNGMENVATLNHFLFNKKNLQYEISIYNSGFIQDNELKKIKKITSEYMDTKITKYFEANRGNFNNLIEENHRGKRNIASVPKNVIFYIITAFIKKFPWLLFHYDITNRDKNLYLFSSLSVQVCKSILAGFCTFIEHELHCRNIVLMTDFKKNNFYGLTKYFKDSFEKELNKIIKEYNDFSGQTEPNYDINIISYENVNVLNGKKTYTVEHKPHTINIIGITNNVVNLEKAVWNIGDYSLIIDEADMCFSTNKKLDVRNYKKDDYVIKLIKKSVSTYAISATNFGFMIKKELSKISKKFIYVPIPNSQETLFNEFDLTYKGFHDMTIENVTQFNTSTFKRHTRINPHPAQQPILGLASISKWTNNDQKDQALAYVKGNKKTVSIVYAGDVCQIYFSNDVPLPTFTKTYKKKSYSNIYKEFNKSQEFGRWCNGEIDLTGKENGKSIQGSKVMIEHMLDHLKFLNKVQNIQFDRIMIFAVFKAGRAETFKSSDRKWILTKLFLDLPANSHRENIIQRFRIYGQYNLEEVPQHVHQTFYIKKKTEEEIKNILDDKFNFQLRLINSKNKVDTLKNLLQNVNQLPLKNNRKFTRSDLETKEVMGYKKEIDLHTKIYDLENSRNKMDLAKQKIMQYYPNCNYSEIKELTEIYPINKSKFIEWVKIKYDQNFTGFKNEDITNGNIQKVNKYIKEYLKEHFPTIKQNIDNRSFFGIHIARNPKQAIKARKLIKTLKGKNIPTGVLVGLNEKTNLKNIWYIVHYKNKIDYTNEIDMYEDGIYIRHDFTGELIITTVKQGKVTKSGIKHLIIK